MKADIATPPLFFAQHKASGEVRRVCAIAMTWDDFERVLCFLVVRASHERAQTPIIQLWRDEFAKQFEGRWITGRHYEPNSVDHLPADHPLRAPFR